MHFPLSFLLDEHTSVLHVFLCHSHFHIKSNFLYDAVPVLFCQDVGLYRHHAANIATNPSIYRREKICRYLHLRIGPTWREKRFFSKLGGTLQVCREIFKGKNISKGVKPPPPEILPVHTSLLTCAADNAANENPARCPACWSFTCVV